MFDIGFSELVIIALVGLIVIGPERLPKVARTVGALLGRLQRYVSDVKTDINRELQLEELRKMQSQVEASARDVELSINRETNSVEQSLNAAIGDAGPAPDGAAAIGSAATEPPPAEPGAAGPPAPVSQLELELTAAAGDKKGA